MTALHVAALYGQIAVVTLLLQRGGDVTAQASQHVVGDTNAPRSQGRPPPSPAMAALIQARAEVSTQSNVRSTFRPSESTPPPLACYCRKARTSQLLDSQHEATPLHVAAQEGHPAAMAAHRGRGVGTEE